MSFDRGRHEAWEELLSAHLTGDLTVDEERRVQAHLAGCEVCQATYAAFSDGRRVVAGLRHHAPPRDLGARVRGGIEAGAFSRTPWWRRPPAIFAGVGGGLAVVAGALLALVIVNQGPDHEVGRTSPSPIPSSTPAVETVAPTPETSAPVVTPTPGASLPPPATPDPSVSADPDATPTPPATPPELASSPAPDLYLAVTGPVDDPALTMREGQSGDEVGEVDAQGEPIAAVLSDDGQWLASITRLGLTGMQRISVTRVTDAAATDDPDAAPPLDTPIEVSETVDVADGRAGGPFLEQLSWSADGRYLAYTLADLEQERTEAWVFDTTTAESTPLTDTGAGYAGSFVRDEDGADWLWISTAADEPTSYLVPMADDGPRLVDLGAVDPADVATNVFQPVVASNGSFAIFWRGHMALTGGEWTFSEGGAPYLAEERRDDDGSIGFPNERPLFTDVTVDRDAFTSAAITWGPGGYTFAAWDVAWTGLPQSADEAYPARDRVYYGSITDGGLGRGSALDASDLPTDIAEIVDVKISPTGRHLLITVSYPVPGELAAPTADLLIVERTFDGNADDVRRLNDESDGWFGPAAFSDRWARSQDGAEAP